jgi:hypothetical protein
MQDRDELAISHHDHLKLFWKIPQKRYDHKGGAVVYSYESSDLLEDVLRTNADFYVFGGLRDPLAALGLLMAGNTGARGIMATIHSLSVLDTLYRLETMLGLALNTAVVHALREMIARFVDLILHMEYDEQTRERWIGTSDASGTPPATPARKSFSTTSSSAAAARTRVSSRARPASRNTPVGVVCAGHGDERSRSRPHRFAQCARHESAFVALDERESILACHHRPQGVRASGARLCARR